MAIRLKFDNTGNVETPTVVLATRSGNKLGCIPAHGITFRDTMQSYEMSFKVNKNENGKTYPLWNQLKDFKLAWVREWDRWFEIKVDLDEGNEIVKNVTAKSLGEAELSQINLYGIEVNTEDDIARDDYKPTVLYDRDDPSASLLNRLLSKAPHYSIGSVDISLVKLQRTFAFDDTSILDAFQSIAKEINCLFDIDCSSDSEGKIKRVVNVYDLESHCLSCGERGTFEVCPKCLSTEVEMGYGEDTTIFVSTDNLAENINYSTDVDSVKNCFKLETGDELMTATVINCNPNGSSYLWYISDDVKEDMSDELVAKLEEYDSKYLEYQKAYATVVPVALLEQYNALVDKYSVYTNELTHIEGNIVGYPALMNTFYNAIDFNLYLTHKLMPNITPITTSASERASLLTASNLSPVSVLSLKAASLLTITNAVIGMAKVVVGGGYKIEAINTSVNDNLWTGTLVVTSYADEEDIATSDRLEIMVNEDYEQYVRQKIDKAIYQDSEETTDIVELFGLDKDGFISELKKYCLSELNSIKSCCQGCLNVLIEQGIANEESDLYEALYAKYYEYASYIDAEIKIRESEIAIVVGLYDTDGSLIEDGLQSIIEDAVATIQDELNFEEFLGQELWCEFSAYRREDTYRNDNYISDGLDNAQLFQNALEFIEVAEKEIFKSATLQHSISATLNNLLVMPEFSPLVEHFEIGNWIRIRVDEKVYRLRLIEYEINFDDLDGISIVFSDVTHTQDGVNDVESILNQAASMSTSYASVSRQAGKGSKSGKQLDDWTSKGLSLTQMKIVDNADNQNVSWDEHGLLCREYEPITENYSDEQIKIINKGLYVTDDNWKTSRAGIGKFFYYDPETNEMKEAYGVIADTLVGSLVLSEKVGVYNPTGSIRLNEDGVQITANITEGSDGSDESNVAKELFVIQKKYTDTDNEEVIDKLLYVNSNGELVLNGSVNINMSSGSSGDAGETPVPINRFVVSVNVYYALSDSPTDEPNSGWSMEPLEWSIGKYLWQKSITNYGDGSFSESEPVCITDEQREVKSIEEQYCLLNTREATEEHFSNVVWSAVCPTWQEGYYIYTRSKILWNDDSEPAFSEPVLATAINDANDAKKQAEETASYFRVENGYAEIGSPTSGVKSKYESNRIGFYTDSDHLLGYWTQNSFGIPNLQSFVLGKMEIVVQPNGSISFIKAKEKAEE